MDILATQSNLKIVRDAIAKLVQGERLVSFECTDIHGRKTAKEFAKTNLNELIDYERSLAQDLNPTPLMEVLDVEIEF